MPAGAIPPAVVAKAAIDAVEADRVHAIVGPALRRWCGSVSTAC
jgi:hypothetical protein